MNLGMRWGNVKRTLGLAIFVTKKRDIWKKDSFKKCKWANGSAQVRLQKKNSGWIDTLQNVSIHEAQISFLKQACIDPKHGCIDTY